MSKCPMKFSQDGLGAAGNRPDMECEREQCAWWVGANLPRVLSPGGGCAIAIMAIDATVRLLQEPK
jgi:hypothetical protein